VDRYFGQLHFQKLLIEHSQFLEEQDIELLLGTSIKRISSTTRALVVLWTPCSTPDSVNRPAASYKASETTVELECGTYRAVVVYSDSHDKRRRKKIDKTLASSEKELETKLKEK